VDMGLEVVVLPVADVDRAKSFYKQTMGWREDADIAYMRSYGAGMADRPYHHGNLRAALLAEAERTLREEGIERLSLRDLPCCSPRCRASPHSPRPAPSTPGRSTISSRTQ
jgi:hypothetical protein